MKRYQELLDGKLTMQDLTDKELKELRRSWGTKDGHLLPATEYWEAVPAEQRRREIERATKPKPIIKDFFT